MACFENGISHKTCRQLSPFVLTDLLADSKFSSEMTIVGDKFVVTTDFLRFTRLCE